MEELTYFESLTYIQSGISISKDGITMTEDKVNHLFLLEDDDAKILFRIN